MRWTGSGTLRPGMDGRDVIHPTAGVQMTDETNSLWPGAWRPNSANGGRAAAAAAAAALLSAALGAAAGLRTSAAATGPPGFAVFGWHAGWPFIWNAIAVTENRSRSSFWSTLFQTNTIFKHIGNVTLWFHNINAGELRERMWLH